MQAEFMQQKPCRGFVAFAKENWLKVMENGRLTPAKFGHPHRWVPMTFTGEAAIEKAMMAHNSVQCAQAASSTTQWFLLCVDIPVETFWKYAQNDLINFTSSHSRRTGLPLNGWNFFGEIELGNGNDYQCASCKVPPIGLQPWAHMALQTRRFRPVGQCFGCGCREHSGVWEFPIPWNINKISESGAYCALCWNKHFMRSLQEMEEAAKLAEAKEAEAKEAEAKEAATAAMPDTEMA